MVARHVFPILEASAADRGLAGVEVLGRRAGRGLLRHDVNRRHVGGDQRVRGRRLEANRVRIDNFLAGDGLGVSHEGTRAIRDLRHAVDRERDVLCRELAAVVEFHPFAQLELPGQRIDHLPRGREARNHFRVRIHLHELVENVLGHVVVRKQVEKVRIHRRDVGGNRDLQLLRRHGKRDCTHSERCYGEGGIESGTAHDVCLEITNCENCDSDNPDANVR